MNSLQFIEKYTYDISNDIVMRCAGKYGFSSEEAMLYLNIVNPHPTPPPPPPSSVVDNQQQQQPKKTVVKRVVKKNSFPCINSNKPTTNSITNPTNELESETTVAAVEERKGTPLLPTSTPTPTDTAIDIVVAVAVAAAPSNNPADISKNTDETKKEPKKKAVKEAETKEVKAPKEPKVKEPKEPKEPKEVKEPKEPKEPKEVKVKEPKAPKAPKVKASKEPKAVDKERGRPKKDDKVVEIDTQQDLFATLMKEAVTEHTNASKNTEPSSTSEKTVDATTVDNNKELEMEEEDEEEPVSVSKFEFNGKEYLMTKCSQKILYDPKTQDVVGKWNEVDKCIDSYREEEEDA